MNEELNQLLSNADALIDEGHLGEAQRKLKQGLKDFEQETSSSNLIREKLCRVMLRRDAFRDSAIVARDWIASDPSSVEAKICLIETLVRFRSYAEAEGLLPICGAESRQDYKVMAAIVALWCDRDRADHLWLAGEFERAHQTYANVHNQEQAMLSLLDEAGDLWDVVFNALGKEEDLKELSPLFSIETSAERTAFQESYIERRTHGRHRGGPKGKKPTVVTYHSIWSWPNKDEIFWQDPSPKDRLYAPSPFGAPGNDPVRPVVQQRSDVILKIPSATVYNHGNYFLVHTKDGLAPCLQEGVWGGRFSDYLGNMFPSPFFAAEGRAGICSVMAFVPVETKRIEKPAVMIGYFNNYGHFLHDIVPQIRRLEEKLGPDIALIVVDDTLPIIKQILQKLGYGEDRLIAIGERKSVLCDELYCLSPSTLLQHRHNLVTPNKFWFRHYDMALDDEGVRYARSRLMRGVETKAATRKIYVSRNKAFRRIRNEPDLEKLMTRLGFEIVEPENLTLDGQIELFSSTAYLVAQEGSALANMTFMQKGAKILSLRSPAWGWTVNCFDELARIFNLDYQPFDFASRSIDLEKAAPFIESWLRE